MVVLLDAQMVDLMVDDWGYAWAEKKAGDWVNALVVMKAVWQAGYSAVWMV